MRSEHDYCNKTETMESRDLLNGYTVATDDGRGEWRPLAVRRANREGEPTTVDISCPGSPPLRIKAESGIKAEIVDVELESARP